MADLTKYPNPLRLFTQTRDKWFTDFVEEQGIPMHVFSAVRDTQLGQLMFAIETVRMKKKRAGEEPGPNLLEGDNAVNFIPLFQIVQQFHNFLNHEDISIELDKLAEEMNTIEIEDKLNPVKKQNSEWFTALKEERLNEIYTVGGEILNSQILQPIVRILNLDDLDELKDKIQEIDETFAETLFRVYDPVIHEKIREKEYKVVVGDQKVISFNIDDEEIELAYNDYHSRVNIIYSLILEIVRLIEQGNDYGYQFNFIEQLLTLEMLIMIPQADKSRIPLVKQHLDDLNKNSSLPREFWDVLSVTYQTFCHMEESSRKFLQKLFKNNENNLKETSRILWKKLIKNIFDDGDPYNQSESVIAITWCHYRLVQAQGQHQEEQTQSQSRSYNAMVRLEHVFWVQGREYLNTDTYKSPYQFWSKFASIANKQIRTEQDSLNLFHELDKLIQKTGILDNSNTRDELNVQEADLYSLLQSILSYGLEARTDEIYDKLEIYVDRLEQLLDEIDETRMHAGFDLEREQSVVENIRRMINNPVAKSN